MNDPHNYVCTASSPTLTSSVTDRCIVQGKYVSLTCKVTYNGTHLMPLNTYWYLVTSRWTRPGRYNYDYTKFRSNNTVNDSSVFQSSETFTANETIVAYWCAVSFSSPTGRVIPGVASQYSYYGGTFWSTPVAPRTVASKIAVYLY